MNPKDPIVIERQQHIRDSLLKGESISSVAKKVGVSRKRVYDLAHRDKLPFNPPVKRGGSVERRILEAYASGFSLSEIGDMFKCAPLLVQRVLNRFKGSEVDT